MNEQGMLSIDKIPVRLSLKSLDAQACLNASARNYFSARGKHPTQHPLMHQIGRNPDCQALAICSGDTVLAHCFFHDRTHTATERSTLLHTFMVAPYMRRRGLGSFLFLQMMRHLLQPGLQRFDLKSDFENASALMDLASPLVKQIHDKGGTELEGEDIQRVLREIDDEEPEMIRKVLHSLIILPDFRLRVERKGCHIGAISDSNDFYSGISALEWPAHVAVQSIHPDFHRDLEPKLRQLDLLVLDGKHLVKNMTLLADLERRHPELPVAVVNAPDDLESPSVLWKPDLAGLAMALGFFMEQFKPVPAAGQNKVLKGNLLNLPERGSLAYYRNRHRGQRVFIVASGPSLTDVDASLLDKEITLTINDALRKFPRTRYAAIMDSRKLHELHMELLNVDTAFTLAGNSMGVEIKLLGTEGFSMDAEKGLYSGYTTAYLCLQLALHMGFREIYYLGLDLGNTRQKSHFFGNRPLQDQDRPEVYAKMRQSFERVADTVLDMGVQVYNCSPVSELKCFPFKALEQVLEEPPQGR